MGASCSWIFNVTFQKVYIYSLDTIFYFISILAMGFVLFFVLLGESLVLFVVVSEVCTPSFVIS